MDLTTVLASGLFSAVFVLGGGLIAYRFLKERIIERSYELASEFIEQIPKQFEQDPELMGKFMNIAASAVLSLVQNEKFMTDVSKPVMAVIMKNLSSIAEKGADGAIGPSIKLPFLGKVPLSMIMSFMGNQGKQAVASGAKEAVTSLLS